MSIKNPDGSTYKPTGSLQQFDPENPELELFNSFDQEVIEIGGSPIFYYEVFINVSSIDELYVEARDKIFSPIPKMIYGYYEPTPTQNMMGVFGGDSPDEMMFEFNYDYILKNLGHAPKIGSRLFTPQKRENWQVVQNNIETYKMWGQLRLQVMCIRYQESLTTGEGKVTQREPDFKINSIKDLSAERIKFAGGQPPVS